MCTVPIALPLGQFGQNSYPLAHSVQALLLIGKPLWFTVWYRSCHVGAARMGKVWRPHAWRCARHIEVFRSSSCSRPCQKAAVQMGGQGTSPDSPCRCWFTSWFNGLWCRAAIIISTSLFFLRPMLCQCHQLLALPPGCIRNRCSFWCRAPHLLKGNRWSLCPVTPMNPWVHFLFFIRARGDIDCPWRCGHRRLILAPLRQHDHQRVPRGKAWPGEVVPLGSPRSVPLPFPFSFPFSFPVSLPFPPSSASWARSRRFSTAGDNTFRRNLWSSVDVTHAAYVLAAASNTKATTGYLYHSDPTSTGPQWQASRQSPPNCCQGTAWAAPGSSGSRWGSRQHSPQVPARQQAQLDRKEASREPDPQGFLNPVLHLLPQNTLEWTTTTVFQLPLL